jgi:hypothetical protein
MYRIVFAALLGIMVASTSASAHAILIKSEPMAGATVAAGTLAMSFRYNSRIDQARSRLTLIKPDRNQTTLKIAPSAQPDTLETTAQVSVPGAYVVRWQVLALDGHITRGDVPFTVAGH